MRLETDTTNKDRIREICRKYKGVFVNYSDGKYSCKGVLDDTIDYELGKISLVETGSKSRLRSAKNGN